MFSCRPSGVQCGSFIGTCLWFWHHLQVAYEKLKTGYLNQRSWAQTAVVRFVANFFYNKLYNKFATSSQQIRNISWIPATVYTANHNRSNKWSLRFTKGCGRSQTADAQSTHNCPPVVKAGNWSESATRSRKHAGIPQFLESGHTESRADNYSDSALSVTGEWYEAESFSFVVFFFRIQKSVQFCWNTARPLQRPMLWRRSMLKMRVIGTWTRQYHPRSCRAPHFCLQQFTCHHSVPRTSLMLASSVPIITLQLTRYVV